MGQKKITQEKLTKKIKIIEGRLEKMSKKNPSINVVYDHLNKTTLVYMTDVEWYEAYNHKGKGFCFTLSEGLAQELMLKLQMEPQMTQEEANNEMLSPNERNKHNDY
jgi:hypothetical protein